MVDLRHRRDDHRAAQRGRQPLHRGAGFRALGGDAGHDDRPTRLLEHFQDRLESAVRNDPDALDRATERGKANRVVDRRCADEVRGSGDVDRAGTLGDCRAQGALHDLADGLRRDRRGPFGNRPEKGVVVQHLVREQLLALGLDLARDRQHGDAIEIGVGDGVHEVRRAGTERGQAYARLAGELTVGLRHQTRGSLAGREHERHVLAARGLEELDAGIAGVAEDAVDACRLEVGDNDV